jgi:hypothetical protein
MLHGLPIHGPTILKDDPSAKLMIASEYFEQIQQTLLSEKWVNKEQILPLPARMLAVKTFENDTHKAAVALDVLSACCHFLAELKVSHYLDAGTLLGMYRDQALIPWDDDLDLSVTSSDVELIQSALPKLMETLKEVSEEDWEFNAYKATQAYGNVPNGAVRSFKVSCFSATNLPSIDFFVKYVGLKNSDHCLASRGISIPAAYSESVVDYPCGDHVWPIPINAAAYLEHHYGDWRTPNKDWSISELTSAQTF